MIKVSQTLLASKPSSKKEKGFTLLEVMVALAILAVVAVSASQASRSYLHSVDTMKARSRAYFVAQNALADLRIQQILPTSVQKNQVDMAGRQWQVTITPTDTKVDTLTQISVAVAPMDNEKANNTLVALDAILSKPTGQP